MFMNHSCEPTCWFEPDELNRHDGVVVMTATRDLSPGDELTFDYGEGYWHGCSAMIQPGTDSRNYTEAAWVKRDAEAKEKLLSVGFAVDDSTMAPASLTKQVGRLSGGWRMKCALTRAMLMKADILLLDEPTNHLDPGNVKWVMDYLCSLSNVTSAMGELAHRCGVRWGAMRIAPVISATLILVVFPLWVLMVVPDQSWASLLAEAMFGVFDGILGIVLILIAIELFPVSVRATGIGLSYNMSQSYASSMGVSTPEIH